MQRQGFEFIVPSKLHRHSSHCTFIHFTEADTGHARLAENTKLAAWMEDNGNY
jgi:hypothetical protein